MASRSTGLLPHGLCPVVLVVLAAIGWFLSLWQGDGCNYAIVSGPIVDQLDPSYTSRNPITTLELGFDSFRELPDIVTIGPSKNSSSSIFKNFSATFTDGNSTENLLLKPRQTSCILYPPEVAMGIVDSKWTTSRSFAFLGLVLGGASSTFLGCSFCFVFSKVTWRWTGYGLLLAAVFQILSLVTWFSTQLCSWNYCGWSRGSISDLCASGVWMITGAAVICHYPAPRYNDVISSTEEQEQQEAPNVDGKRCLPDGTDDESVSTSPVAYKIPNSDAVAVQARIIYDEEEGPTKLQHPEAEIA